MRVDPTQYIWWLVSRAAGIVALGLISLSVLIGLTMATKILRRPGLPRKLARLHEHVALVALAAIALHGVSLLGDRWLRAGLSGIIVPFSMSYRPLFTGLGIIAAYLAALLGLSFYVRRTIGTRLWRKLHRATVAVWVLGVVHTLGSGTDASTVWLRMMMLVMGAPIVFLALLRVLQGGQPNARPLADPVAPGALAESQSRGKPAPQLQARTDVARAPSA
jgi:methionine sulfoxide reductase heme-binding subunit